MGDFFSWLPVYWGLRLLMLLLLSWAIWVGLLFALRFLRWDNVVQLATGDRPSIKEFKLGQFTMSIALKEREERQDKQLTALDTRLREVEDKQQALNMKVEDIESRTLGPAAEEQ